LIYFAFWQRSTGRVTFWHRGAGRRRACRPSPGRSPAHPGSAPGSRRDAAGTLCRPAARARRCRAGPGWLAPCTIYPY
jgi:hypothetical protein